MVAWPESEVWRGEDRTEMKYLVALAGNSGVDGRMPIAQLGIRYRGKQKVEITRDMMSQVAANFKKLDTGEVPVDYDHALEVAAGSGEPVPAAGWIKTFDDVPDRNGIYWANVQWTARAAAMIRAGEYRYVSPVLVSSVRDDKTGLESGWALTSAALTNRPVLKGMPALVLSTSGWVACSDGSGDGMEGRAMNDGWNKTQIEIDRRTNALMAANRNLGYSDAFNTVMKADPSLASKRWADAEAQVIRCVNEMIAAHPSITYGAALAAVTDARSDLAREYRAARIGAISPQTCRPPDDALGVEISEAVTQKLQASEGRVDYGEALRLVLREQPSLARRYRESIR